MDKEFKDKVDAAIETIKTSFGLENCMAVTRSRLANATKNGKHLNLDKLIELGNSTDKNTRVKFAQDIAHIVNDFNSETNELKYEPNCGWEE